MDGSANGDLTTSVMKGPSSAADNHEQGCASTTVPVTNGTHAECQAIENLSEFSEVPSECVGLGRQEHESSGSEEKSDRLLKILKREVKQIMEEAVAKRLMPDESNSVTSLCAAVEMCLADGLKQRVLGLFGTSSTFALLHKLSKLCPPAGSVLKLVLEEQQKELKSQSWSSMRSSVERWRGPATVNDLPVRARYQWIRVALVEKLLDRIVEFVANNASRYYNADAIMMDPVRGHMIATLLGNVGPCALDYTRMKSIDHYLSDPTADDLVQRHRINSGSASPNVQASPRRPPLSVTKRGSSTTLSTTDQQQDPVQAKSGRDYVFSLHQNLRSTLLYGKNNVSVSAVDQPKPLKGYLSLHQNANGSLTIKWTPNELMHCGSVNAFGSPSPVPPSPRRHQGDKGSLWRYALNLNVQDIVYLHLHQKGDSGGTLVFVGVDGVQYPPVHFPPGQHPLSFLSCLENGLLPWSQLDPPLWLSKGKAVVQTSGQILPRLRRKVSQGNVQNGGRFIGLDFQQQLNASETASTASSTDEIEAITGVTSGGAPENTETFDYVFRIVPGLKGTSLDSGDDGVSKGKSSVSSSSQVPSSAPPTSSRLVALSGFSSLFKERFISLSGSPGSSPPPTPPVTANSATTTVSDFIPSQTESAPTSPPFSSNESHNEQTHENEATDEQADVPITTAPNKRHSDPSAHCAGNSGEKSGDTTTHLDEAFARSALLHACDSMRSQILSRAFYGWLAHCRHLRTVRNHLSCLLNGEIVEPIEGGVTSHVWNTLREQPTIDSLREFHRRVYFGGVAPELRLAVWPYLLEFLPWTADCASVNTLLDDHRSAYESVVTEWLSVEAIVRQRDKEAFDAARVRTDSTGGDLSLTGRDRTLSNDVFDGGNCDQIEDALPKRTSVSSSRKRSDRSTPVEGDGGVYTKELVDTFALNLHRIEKDVHRCDRNHPYFVGTENLEKLKNLMCTYVWENLEHGYVQGMCDLAAPLLVIFDDEVLTHGCFVKLMAQMLPNFPHGGGMDAHLANMRSLIQVMDPEVFDLIHQNGDYTHFYFCYRWFLLDFKRELAYADVFRVWEVIWAAGHCASTHFTLFLALSLLRNYRDIILDNNMDFTDIIKFFNEMAERHDADAALNCAREQVRRLQLLIADSNVR